MGIEVVATTYSGNLVYPTFLSTAKNDSMYNYTLNPFLQIVQFTANIFSEVVISIYEDGKNTIRVKSMENSDVINSKENLALLDSFLALEQNWDDCGSKTFTREHINFIKDIIENLDYQPEIFPTGRESILFEYYRSNGDVLLLELFKDRNVSMFKKLSDGTRIEKKIDVDNIRLEIGMFHGQI